MTAKGDDALVAHVEGVRSAPVPTPSELEGMASGFDRDLLCLVRIDRSHTYAVDVDLEGPATKLDAEPFSGQLKGC